MGSQKDEGSPAEPLAGSIRDTLFGDRPLEQWPGGPNSAEPWASFVRARDVLQDGRRDDAIANWQAIVRTPGLESRHYAQAWSFLRAHGIEAPKAASKQLLGVVLEVSMNVGLDLLAAYPDHTARYYNCSGSGVVWEHADASLDSAIDELLAAGQRVLDQIGPWDGARPAAPQQGQVRLSFLSPSGLHFGQGPMQTLQRDAMAGPVIAAGVRLMQAMIAKVQR